MKLPVAAAPGAAITEDDWAALRAHTAARIALGRSGASLPTRERLAFGLAHAQARDAVHAALDVAALAKEIEALGVSARAVNSRAATRAAYLARPDWGRRLDAASATALADLRDASSPVDLVIVVGDGLSALAVQRHAPAVLAALLPRLVDLRLAPVVIATQARVALADEVGEILGARLALSLIGERPGLSAPDSLGAYLTFEPRIGRSDAERNCISNIRAGGLAPEMATAQIEALLRAALAARCSGVALAYSPVSAPVSALSSPSA